MIRKHVTDQSVIQLPGSYAVDHMALIDWKEPQDSLRLHEADAASDTNDLICRFPFADDSATDSRDLRFWDVLCPGPTWTGVKTR